MEVINNLFALSFIYISGKMDADYNPPEMETRTLFGLQMEQKRNDAVIDSSLFTNIVTKRNQACESSINFSSFF